MEMPPNKAHASDILSVTKQNVSSLVLELVCPSERVEKTVWYQYSDTDGSPAVSWQSCADCARISR